MRRTGRIRAPCKLTGREEGFIPASLEQQQGSGDKSLFPTIIVLTRANAAIA